MNELMIVLENGGGWLYFQTNQVEADKAFTKFTESCASAGLNIDNMNVISAELRDSDGLVIDSTMF